MNLVHFNYKVMHNVCYIKNNQSKKEYYIGITFLPLIALWSVLWSALSRESVFNMKDVFFFVCLFFSSPEPSGSQGELIVYPCSGVRCHCRCHRRRRCRRRQQCLNIFSSETALPIKAKLYVEPPWEGGTKVYINGPGHMTKVAAMPIYGKNL